MTNRWGNNGNSDRLYFWGLQNPADGDCSHEIKRRLLLGRNAVTNLVSVLKSRDITLPTKVLIVKAMVFPSVSYGFPISVDGKESACNAGDQDLIPVGKILWRREWQPTPGFLPREFHGQITGSQRVGHD